MIPHTLESDRLSLIRTTPDQLKVIGSRDLLDGFIFEPGWLEDLADLQESAEHVHESDWWLPLLICLRGQGRVIGIFLFKGPPDGSGSVEIAYSIAPSWRCQGYAKEVLAVILDALCTVSGIRQVCAHTLPEMNASSRVLAHCGFEKVRVIEEVDLGPVWRWEKSGLCPQVVE